MAGSMVLITFPPIRKDLAVFNHFGREQCSGNILCIRDMGIHIRFMVSMTDFGENLRLFSPLTSPSTIS